MSYLIYNANGTLLVELQDQTTNATVAPITLIGRNTLNYGQYLNTDLVQMVENFANTTAPTAPLQGMLWFNSVTNTLNLYDETASWQGIATETWVQEYVAQNNTGNIPTYQYQPSIHVAGTITTGEVLLVAASPVAVQFAANFGISVAGCLTAPASISTFTINKNGAAVGTITIAVNGHTATFASVNAAPVNFNAGDVLTIVATTVDPALADFYATLAGSFV